MSIPSLIAIFFMMIAARTFFFLRQLYRALDFVLPLVMCLIALVMAGPALMIKLFSPLGTWFEGTGVLVFLNRIIRFFGEIIIVLVGWVVERVDDFFRDVGNLFGLL